MKLHKSLILAGSIGMVAFGSLVASPARADYPAGYRPDGDNVRSEHQYQNPAVDQNRSQEIRRQQRSQETHRERQARRADLIRQQQQARRAEEIRLRQQRRAEEIRRERELRTQQEYHGYDR